MNDQTKGYLPPGCRCDPRDWYPLDAPVPDVCANFAACEGRDDCATCSHEYECHQQAKDAEAR
jgi:hypothetical protein